MPTLNRIYLAVNLLVYGGYAIGFFAAPAQLAALTDIQLPTATAIADLRATYGGLSFAIALLLLRGLLSTKWEAPALLLATAGAAGLGFGRIVTIVTGQPGMIIYAILATEVVAAAAGAWLISRGSTSSAPAAAQRFDPSAAGTTR
jgi:hypothetical protein